MTTVAFRAIAAFMHIIFLVAADAAHRQHGFARDGQFVACIAIQSPVSPIQAKLGTFVMVEIP